MRADRLISIVLLLQANGRMTAQALASRLEVSQRTILRDMDALSSAGVPVLAERGAGGRWRLIDGYETKLTGLTLAEIRSLFLARPPALLADLGLKEAADAAWLKLRAALPVGVREQAEFVRQRLLIDSRNWRDSTESLTSLPVILEALWGGQRLKFLYEKADGEAGERQVDPLGLVARANRWYLVAARSGERRTYRVSRIRSPEILPEHGERPPDFDLAAYSEASTNRFREHLPRYRPRFSSRTTSCPVSATGVGACSSACGTASGIACRCASTCSRRHASSRCRSAPRSRCSIRRSCATT
jgi:predicted DNA-binding transcriptional regulator YafY